MKSFLFEKCGHSVASLCHAISPYSIWVFEKCGSVAASLGFWYTTQRGIFVCINNNKNITYLYIYNIKTLILYGENSVAKFCHTLPHYHTSEVGFES